MSPLGEIVAAGILGACVLTPLSLWWQDRRAEARIRFVLPEPSRTIPLVSHETSTVRQVVDSPAPYDWAKEGAA